MKRPKTLRSVTTKYQTERGSLYIAVSVNENDRPCEIYGWFGKNGMFERGVTELACRLAALSLRSGASVKEVIEQCRDINEMQSWPNEIDDRRFSISGIGDCIANSLRPFVNDD